MVRGIIVFLDKKYILANELVEKMNISMSFISKLSKYLENESVMKKLNNCTFIDTTSNKLPKNIKNALKKYTFTDISNKLPFTYFRDEFGLTESELKNSGIINDVIVIAGKKFYVFSNEFIANTKNCIGYILNEKETFDCYNRNLINGYIQVTKKKYFVWYSTGYISGKEVHIGEYKIGTYQ